jgi:hypothetical protein
MWKTLSPLRESFAKEGLRVYDLRDNFLRVCVANFSTGQVVFKEKHISPQAILELYGCVRLENGLYRIPNNICTWNFTGLLPLTKYYIGDGFYAQGPNRAVYWLEQYYGKGWRTPNVYAGDKEIDNICAGEP